MDSSNDTPSPIESLVDEFLERRRRGEQPTIEEFVAKHPELAGEIAEVFAALAVMEHVAPISADLSPDSSLSVSPAEYRPEQIGDYRILREIGRGGMGVVYEAEQQSLRRRVALKVLPRQMARDPKAIERFSREARATARMHHTNIVPVFDVGQDDQHFFFAMQLIQGQGLDQVIDELKRLRDESAANSSETSGNCEVLASDVIQSPSIAKSLMSGHFEQQDLGSASTGALFTRDLRVCRWK